MIVVKRVYEAASHEDGQRFLVDRLWPRGIKKDELEMEGWSKDVAPSNELRKWFNHDPAKSKEFQRKYFAELDANPAAWQPLLHAARSGKITLLYSARDTEENNALSLKEYLEGKLSHASHAHS